MAGPDSPITEVDWGESGPGASVSRVGCPRVQKEINGLPPHPTVINTWGSSGVIRMGACVETPGTFSPDGLESLTPETYASRGSLSSTVVLHCVQIGHGAGVGLDT